MKFIYKKSYDEDLIDIYSAEDLARLIKDNIEYYEDIAKFSQASHMPPKISFIHAIRAIRLFVV